MLHRVSGPNDVALLSVSAVLSRPLGGELGFDPHRLLVELGERLGALIGDVRLETVLYAVRGAQLDALDFILRHHARSVHRRWADDILGFAEFSGPAWRFIARERAPLQALHHGPASEAAAGDRSDRRLERMAAAAFLDELADSCGTPPTSVASLIADVENELGWFDAFAIFLSQELVSHEDLRSIFFERPLAVTKNLRVTTAEIVARLHQHAALLANRFHRQSVRDDPTEDWAAHEREEDRRLASLPEDKARHLHAAIDMIAVATDLPSTALLRLASMMPVSWIGTPLVLEHMEEQAGLIAILRRHIEDVIAIAGGRTELDAAWSDVIAHGRVAGLAMELDRIAADAVATIAGGTSDTALTVIAHQKAAVACIEGLGLRYGHAAKVYADAGRLVWAMDSDLGFRFLLSSARASLSQGRWFSEQGALRDALALLGDLELHYRQQDPWARAEYCVVSARARICFGILSKSSAEIEAGIAAADDIPASGSPLSRVHASELNATLAEAKLALFRHLDDASFLDGALSDLDTALAHVSRDAEPGVWGALHTLTSIVSLTRAWRVQPPASHRLIERVIESCAAALDVYTPAVAPLRHAELEERLGDAYLFLCSGPATEHYGDAARSHFMAAQGITMPECALAAWTRLQGKIGDIHFRLARGSDHGAWVDAGLDVYAAAFGIATCESHPEHWAALQERLGDISVTVTGPLEARCLDIAQAAFVAAADVHTRETNPMSWARLQTRLGHVHQRRAKGAVAVVEAQAALAAFQRAIVLFPRDKEAKRWAATQHAIGTAYLTMATGPDAHECLSQSLIAHRLALEGRSPDTEADLWIQLQLRIGGIELRLAKEEEKESRGAAALEAYAAGLKVAARVGASERRAEFLEHMGDVRAHMAAASAAEDFLEEAIANYRASLEIRTIEGSPTIWARLQVKIGQAEPRRSRGRDAAKTAFAAAERVYTKDKHPREWESLQSSLARC